MGIAFLKLLINLFLFKRKPFSLVHFITNKCNARCRHCFMDFNDIHLIDKELSLGEIVKLTSSLGRSLLNVNLTGGEPFLRNDIFEITEAYFKNAGVKSVFISTNGMFTGRIEKFIKKFIESEIKGRIIFSISIDNFKSLHNENRRASGLFENAVKSFYLVDSYRSSRIAANINITIAEHNYSDAVNLYYYLKKIGVNSITATALREEGVIKDISVAVKEKIQDSYKELTTLIHGDLLKDNIFYFIKNIYSGMINLKNIILDEVVCRTYLKPEYIFPCSAASLFAVIRADGTVYPCEILNQPQGNLRDYNMDFMRLWRNKKTLERRRLIRDTRCNCVYGCALTVSIVSNPIFFLKLSYSSIKRLWRKNQK